MSEKHERDDNADTGAAGEPNPFALTPRHIEPVPEPDAEAENLQARIDDATETDAAGTPATPVYPDPPRTIVSDSVPAWPEWSNTGSPQLIIYGPTAFKRTPSNVPLDAPAAPATPATPPEDQPTAPEPDVVSPASASPFRTESDIDQPAAYEEIIPEPTESQTPTLPSDSTVPSRPEELDEIFDSIEGIGSSAEPEPPAANADEAFEAAVPLADEVSSPRDVAAPREVPATLMGDVPAAAWSTPERSEPPATLSGPATMSGHWPPPADAPVVPPSDATPATLSGQWPLTPTTEELRVAESELTSGGTVDTDLFEGSLADEPLPERGDEVGLADELTLPMDAEPELAVSERALREEGEAVPVAPVVTTDVEPSSIELAAIPAEPAGAVPVAAVAAGAGAAAVLSPHTDVDHAPRAGGYAHDASHGQTATQFFAHAREDVEHRRGILSFGLFTKLAGLTGLLAFVAATAILFIAGAGMSSLSSQDLGTFGWGLKWGAIWVGGFAILLSVGSLLFRSWWSSAVLAAVIAIIMGGGWFALTTYHGRVEGFNLLGVSPYLTYAGLAGLAVAILGGFIEHRRLREETHVLAALFSNVLALLVGGVLWFFASGGTLLGK